MQAELKQLIASKDVIILTSQEEAAAPWLIAQYKSNSGIQIVENAHQLDSEKILKLCRAALSKGNKIILTARFRSQLPVINIASLCNEEHKLLINIDLSGWNKEQAEPASYSSF